MSSPETSNTVHAIATAALSYSGGLATTHYWIDGETVHALVVALAPVIAIVWSIYTRQSTPRSHDRRKRPF